MDTHVNRIMPSTVNNHNQINYNNKSFLQRIKETTAAKPVEYKYKKISELSLNVKYLIKGIQTENTRFGEKLVVDLEYQGLRNTHEFRTWLPDRFLRITKEDIEDLSSGGFCLIYGGKDNNGIHVIDFDEM